MDERPWQTAHADNTKLATQAVNDAMGLKKAGAGGSVDATRAVPTRNSLARIEAGWTANERKNVIIRLFFKSGGEGDSEMRRQTS